MIFRLEVLEAKEGDCLMLHFGKPEKPRVIVIDGGPGGVYGDRLLPRLQELRAERAGADGKLPIEMVMVSHIDADHITGILEWFRDLRDLKENGEAVPDLIRTLWFNSFNEVLGDASEELRSRLSAVADKAAKGGAETSAFSTDPVQGQHSAAIVASVAQGRELRAIAEKLAIRRNLPFAGMVMPAGSGDQVVPLADGLKLHVVGPTKENLAKLQAQWDAQVKKGPISLAEAAAFSDSSVPNLSSIVVVAELKAGTDTRRILLTGDARADFIWDGLVQSGFLKSRKDTVHFDVIKMPHHGSNRNMRADFLKSVTADGYVISANGKDGNPDPEIFDMIAEARGNAKYTIFITNAKLINDRTKVMNDAIQKTKAKSPKRTIVFRSEAENSIAVDIGAATAKAGG